MRDDFIKIHQNVHITKASRRTQNNMASRHEGGDTCQNQGVSMKQR